MVSPVTVLSSSSAAVRKITGTPGVADLMALHTAKPLPWGQREVHERERVVGVRATGKGHGARLGGGGVHDKALVGQELGEPLNDERIVLGEQNARLVHGSPSPRLLL